MSITTYEDDIREALKEEINAGRLKEAGAADDIFLLLAKNYPLSGSKIDWKRVPGSIEFSEEDQSQQPSQFAEFFDQMCEQFGLNGLVLYVGDGPMDFALEGSAVDMRCAFTVLFDLPQHHYFVGPNASWCMSMTMEGDMAFGFAAVAPLH